MVEYRLMFSFSTMLVCVVYRMSIKLNLTWYLKFEVMEISDKTWLILIWNLFRSEISALLSIAMYYICHCIYVSEVSHFRCQNVRHIYMAQIVLTTVAIVGIILSATMLTGTVGKVVLLDGKEHDAKKVITVLLLRAIMCF